MVAQQRQQQMVSMTRIQDRQNNLFDLPISVHL